MGTQKLPFLGKDLQKVDLERKSLFDGVAARHCDARCGCYYQWYLHIQLEREWMAKKCTEQVLRHFIQPRPAALPWQSPVPPCL
jgi:hypothetical protein